MTICENLGKSRKIQEDLRKSAKIYENLRKSMKIYENIPSILLQSSSNSPPGSLKPFSSSPPIPFQSFQIRKLRKSMKFYEILWKLIQIFFFEPSGGKSHAPDSILRVRRSNSKALGSNCLGGNREAKSIFNRSSIDVRTISAWEGDAP